ncbi:MAG: GNAT family N-acetyltransferase [Roseinatronobacter sp.]
MPDLRLTSAGLPETLRGKDLRLPALTPPPADVLKRYRFRAWHWTDALEYARLLSEPQLWTYLYEDFPGEITEGMARALIDASREMQRHKVRAVEYQGRIIGQTRLQWQGEHTPPQSGELSYWLGRSYWGLGLAAPMIALSSWRCLSLFPALQTITARVHDANLPSRRCLQSLNWQETGREGDWHLFELSRRDGIDWDRLHRRADLPASLPTALSA